MTTPATMDRMVSWLQERLKDAERDEAERKSRAPDGYYTGYAAGRAAEVRELLQDITGDEPC